MLRRYPDWPLRLAGALAAADRAPFRWSRHDCCMFACNVVLAITGTDLAAGLRGRYRSKAGADRLLKKRGGLVGTVERIAAEHGMPEAPPLTAQRGDVVLTDQGPYPALGICCGATVAVAAMEGIERQPLAMTVRAWRV